MPSEIIQIKPCNNTINSCYTNSTITDWYEEFYKEHVRLFKVLDRVIELEKQIKEMEKEMSIMEKQLKEKLE